MAQKTMQGDSYSLPITVTSASGTSYTSSNCAGMRIKVHDTIYVWPDGTLTYDSAAGAWMVPLTQQDTLSFPPLETKVQAQVLVGSNVLTTPVMSFDVGRSIITDEWPSSGE